MSSARSHRVTAAAIALLVLTVPVLWQVAAVRSAQAADAERADLVAETVPTRQAPTDYDGDGIPDAEDTCPQRPERANGFRDSDGCPDVVETTGAS